MIKPASVFYLAPIPMAIVSQDGKILNANDALCRYLGWNEDELQKLSFSEVTWGSDIKDDLKLYNKLIAGEIQQYELVKRYITKYEKKVWGQLRVIGVYDEKDESFQFAIGYVLPIESSGNTSDMVAPKNYLSNYLSVTFKKHIRGIAVFLGIVLTVILNFRDIIEFIKELWLN